MYHYVRPIKTSLHPKIKGLELADFKGQLDHLQHEYTILNPKDFRDAILTNNPLPPRPCLLTFDDGYIDHYQYVFPELNARGLSGIFFTPKTSLLDRKLLEVNKLQFILAMHDQPDNLANELENQLKLYTTIPVEEMRKKYFLSKGFDGPQVGYFKRMLQYALPLNIRTKLISKLFKTYVSTDELEFSEQLYISINQAREMRQAGMQFGGHGNLHLWHSEIGEDDLKDELSGAVQVLKTIGVSQKNSFYSYPFGSQNTSVQCRLLDYGFEFSFTVEANLWHKSSCRRTISRLDTNDLPVKHDPQCNWLKKLEAIN